MTTATAARRSRIGWAEIGLLGLLTFVPLLLGAGGRLNADTKQYLYLDPVGLMERSRTLWDSNVGGGAVTHQAIGYLWPMGPFYALTDALGLPSWAAQRLWVGGLQFVAALGALALFRHLLARSPVHVVAALAYGLSPFVLGHVTNQSGLLVPFAGLPWLVLLMARATESPRTWRWPALFALVVTTCGSLNGSSVFFVVLGAALWAPFARPSPRDGIRVLVRAGSLTLVTQLWWLVAYAVGGANNLPILQITETVATTNATPSATEVLRGLGHWFFYGGDPGHPWLDGLSTPYMRSAVVLVVSFGVPIVALLAGSVLRWRHRAYFVALVGVGTVVAVGAFPIADPSPAGGLFEELSRSSEVVLSLRNTQRAGALVALGLAGLLAAGLHTLHRRHVRAGAAAALAVSTLLLGALPAQWRTGLVNPVADRDDIPAAWHEATDHLDAAGGGRVLELPGSPFADHRWGSTHDPVSVGLSDRPFVQRELVPLGSAAGADLLNALDRSLQEGWFEPASLAPVARLLGAADVLVRNDLAYERHRTPRPRTYWPLFEDPSLGLDPARTFGGPYDNRANEDRPMLDEIELGLDPAAEPPPQLAVLPVPDGGRDALSIQPAAAGTILDGDGEGIVAGAAAGLLDDDGVLLLGPEVVARGGPSGDVSDRTRVVLTDSNRKRATRWYSLRDNVGATEPAEYLVADDLAGDLRLEPAGTTPTGSQTVVEWQGADRIWAAAYGGVDSFAPEERPANAFDGDPSTAWRSELGRTGDARRIGIDLGREVDADTITLLPPQGRLGTVAIARARVTLDGSRVVDVAPPEPLVADAAELEVALDGEPFSTLEVELVETVPPGGLGGLAEVRIPGVEVDEVVVLPTALIDELGQALADHPVAIVLTRLRADPAEVIRDDPEPSITRRFTLPAPLDITLGGIARIDPNGPETALDTLLGAGTDVWPVRARSSARLVGDLDARASSVLDGDLATAWQTPLSQVVGQRLDISLDAPISLDALELDVVADGRHSIPRAFRVTADGQSVDVALPTLSEDGGPQHVSVPLPSRLSGTEWAFEITDIDLRSTIDRQTGLPFTLPVGIAELVLPGVPTRPTADIDTGCRDDLLTIDGSPAGVRVRGTADDADAGLPLELEPCDRDVPTRLAAGDHDVRTAPGRTNGIDIDRLVFTTHSWTETPEVADVDARVTTRSDQPGHVTGTVETDGEPFWLVLDESMNDGWELTIDGADVSGPRPVDSSAAGWLVTPDTPGELSVTARWTPQRSVDVALAVSLLGVLLCLTLAWRGGSSDATKEPATAPPAFVRSPARPSIATIAVGVAAAWLLVAPTAVFAALPLLVLARLFPWLGRMVPLGLVTMSAAAVTVLQIRDDHPADFNWPTQFPWTHQTALLGVILLTVLAVADAMSDPAAAPGAATRDRAE